MQVVRELPLGMHQRFQMLYIYKAHCASQELEQLEDARLGCEAL
jgi:hypothetical protein